MTRIIAGRAKGHSLRTPGHSATRPTTDRVREAFFSVLADWSGTLGEPAATQLQGLAFLDLYAGSGAIALEAASRGAAPVCAVEADAATAKLIKENGARVRLEIEVRATTAERYFSSRGLPRFDVIWADPPYAVSNEQLAPVLEAAASALVSDGLLIVERSGRDLPPIWPEALSEVWLRRYGETTLHFARRPAT